MGEHDIPIEELQHRAEATVGPLFEMKPKKVHAYWQCVRLVPKPEFRTTAPNDFKPADMASSAYCLRCQMGIKYRPGGNAVVEHMKHKHHGLLKSYVEPSASRKAKNKRRKSSDGPSRRKQRRELTGEEKKQVNKALAKWIARRMRPVSIVEDKELQVLCDLFGKFGGFNIELPSRTKMREHILEEAEELRLELKKQLADHSGYYTLTTDVWTDRAARSYMSLTIHFVDDKFKAHSKVLGVLHFPGRHGGDRIGAKLDEMLDDWNLDKDKCVLLLRDGAKNAINGANFTGIKSMSCFAHSLQLVIAGALMRARKPKQVPPRAVPRRVAQKNPQARARSADPAISEHVNLDLNDGRSELDEDQEAEDSETDNDDEVADNELDYQAIVQVRETTRTMIDTLVLDSATGRTSSALNKVRVRVAKFRRVATYFHRSPKAKYRLARIRQAKARKPLTVLLDCPTRWSSTHAMLLRFEELKNDVEAFFAHLGTTAGMREFSDGVLTAPLTHEDWFYARCLCKLLDPFASVTKRLCGEEYPTLILVFPYLRMLKKYLGDGDLFKSELAPVQSEPWAKQVFEDMENVRVSMLQLFTKRFQGLDRDLMWVPVLDPRVADMKYLEPEEHERAHDLLIDAMIQIEESEKRDACGTSSAPATPPHTSARPEFYSPQPQLPQLSVIDQFDAYLYSKNTHPSPSAEQVSTEERLSAARAEAYNYINMAKTDKPTLTPLVWWPANAQLYPTISKLAKKWLGCVATSVPSERAFSTGGNIVTVKRAALTPDMVGKLVSIAQNAKNANDGEFNV
jgi:hypothetical protein